MYNDHSKARLGRPRTLTTFHSQHSVRGGPADSDARAGLQVSVRHDSPRSTVFTNGVMIFDGRDFPPAATCFRKGGDRITDVGVGLDVSKTRIVDVQRIPTAEIGNGHVAQTCIPGNHIYERD